MGQGSLSGERSGMSWLGRGRGLNARLSVGKCTLGSPSEGDEGDQHHLLPLSHL